MIRENKGKGNPVVTEGGGVPDGPKKKYQVRNGGVFGSTIKVIHDGFSFIFPFPPFFPSGGVATRFSGSPGGLLFFKGPIPE